MAYTIHDLNRDLKRDLENHKPKERKTFHRAGDTHGKQGKRKTRNERRTTRQALRRGDW